MLSAPFIFRALSMSDSRRKHHSSNGNDGNDGNSDSLHNERPHPPLSSGSGGFEPISTPIPSETLIEDEVLASLTFSHRGSLMLMGRRAEGVSQGASGVAKGDAARDVPPAIQVEAASGPSSKPSTEPPSERPSVSEPHLPMRLSEDIERESYNVRSMYDGDDTLHWEDGQPPVPSLPVARDEQPERDETAPLPCELAGEPASPSVAPSADGAEDSRSEKNIAAYGYNSLPSTLHCRTGEAVC